MQTLIPLEFYKVLQSRSYTVIILGNETKRFAIYTEPRVGKAIQLYLTQKEHPRPLSHELLNSLITGLGVKSLQIVINKLEETTYFARLFLEQKTAEGSQILEIDCRPSDCILLALVNKIPLLCEAQVFNQALAVEDD